MMKQTVVATRYNSIIRAFHDRLRATGNPPGVARSHAQAADHSQRHAQAKPTLATSLAP